MLPSPSAVTVGPKKSRCSRGIGITSHTTTFYKRSTREVVDNVGIKNTVINLYQGSAFGTFECHRLIGRRQIDGQSLTILCTDTTDGTELAHRNYRRVGCPFSQIIFAQSTESFVIEQCNTSVGKAFGLIIYTSCLIYPCCERRTPWENSGRINIGVVVSTPFQYGLSRHTCRSKNSCY